MNVCRKRKIPAITALWAVTLLFSRFANAAAFTPHGQIASLATQKLLRQPTELASSATDESDENSGPYDATRRDAASGILRSSSLLSAALVAGATMRPDAAAAAAKAKCADIESCREIGERKVEADMKENPTVALPGTGVRYKVLRQPLDERDPTVVADGSKVDLIFSVNAQGAYMYSRGFGFEKVDFGGGRVSDLGIDSLRVVVGRRDVPVGIEQALVGMRRGERRRVNLPPSAGYETSNWEPAPTTRGGKAALKGYRQVLEGRGTNQPPFPAATIWDIEVLKIRN